MVQLLLDARDRNGETALDDYDAAGQGRDEARDLRQFPKLRNERARAHAR